MLDGYALNPGDLDWSPLEKFGKLRVHDRTSASQVVLRARDADIVLTNKSLLLKEQLTELPDLKFISVMATGYNVVDVSYAKKLNIPVSNVRGYSTNSVAQHAFALILELSNQVGFHATNVAQGGWSASLDWCYWKKPLVELSGKNLGIIGYGAIGRKTAEMAMSFGMKVLVYHPRLSKISDEVSLVSLDELFVKSDVISLHVPLTSETENMINRERLKMMKSNAILINTSRGPLINEQDLKWALENHIIAGAGLDVLCSEPPGKQHPLIGAPNCLVTPHHAWATFESRSRLLGETFENVKAFIAGAPRNLVAAS